MVAEHHLSRDIPALLTRGRKESLRTSNTGNREHSRPRLDRTRLAKWVDEFRRAWRDRQLELTRPENRGRCRRSRQRLAQMPGWQHGVFEILPRHDEQIDVP